MADAVGQAERIDALAAIEHDVGEAGSAQEHADDRRDPAFPARQGNQFPRDQVRSKIGAGDFQQLLKRHDRIALDAKVQRNEIGLAARQHRHRRRPVHEMPAVVKLGQRRLDRAVAAIDGEHGRRNPRDRPHRLADLVGALHLIVENVGMLGAKGADPRQLGKVARRLGIAEQGDPRPGHQLPAGPTLRPLM